MQLFVGLLAAFSEVLRSTYDTFRDPPPSLPLLKSRLKLESGLLLALLQDESNFAIARSLYMYMCDVRAVVPLGDMRHLALLFGS